MSYELSAYEGMGSLLARLPFISSLTNIYHGDITEEERDALNRTLKGALAVLMRARQYYQMEEDAVDACAKGFATELSKYFIGPRLKGKPLTQIQEIDGDKWELAFDPGPERNGLMTDEAGRVWRRVQNIDDILLF